MGTGRPRVGTKLVCHRIRARVRVLDSLRLSHATKVSPKHCLAFVKCLENGNFQQVWEKEKCSDFGVY